MSLKNYGTVPVEEVLGPLGVVAGNGASWARDRELADSGRSPAADGTKLDLITVARGTMMMPVGLYNGSLTAVTTFATTLSYWVYVGKALQAFTSASVRCNVATAFVSAGPTPWAELAIASGARPAFGGTPTLTLEGFTDVTATFNSTGLKTTTVASLTIAAGNDVWVGFGSKTTGTLYQLRGLLADDLRTGVFCTATRPSVGPGATTLAGAALVPPWCAVVLS